MLYPHEDRERKQLAFHCRVCDYKRHVTPQDWEENVVQRHNVHFATKEQLSIHPDIVEDPTLGRSRDFKCPSCNHGEAVFFQLPERLTEDAMQLVFVCIKCRNYKLADSK